MNIRRDFGAISAELARLDDVADRVGNDIRAETAQMEHFLASGWNGPAAVSFAAAFRSWVTAARNSVSDMQHLIDAVRQTANEHKAAEQAYTDDVARLDGMLPKASTLPSISSMMGGRRDQD